MTAPDDPAARLAYALGMDPLVYAEIRVAQTADVHLLIGAARRESPGSWPVRLYPADTSTGALARRVLGLLLDLGWVPPDAGAGLDGVLTRITEEES